MMTSSETLFHPRDDSLAEKVRAYADVCKDFTRVQASMKLTRKGMDVDYIGDHAGVMSAYKVICKSLDEASEVISEDDIRWVSHKGLLSERQTSDLVKYRRHREMEAKRGQNSTLNSVSFKR